MDIDTDALLALPNSEKLRLVELLWDNLCQSSDEVALPEWVQQEAVRRRDEMLANPAVGHTHDQVWTKIARRNA